MEIGESYQKFLEKSEKERKPDVKKSLISMGIVGTVLDNMKKETGALSITKTTKIGTRPERVIFEIKSKKVMFSKPDEGDGVIIIKQGKGEEYLRLSLDWFESAQIENNYATGKKSLILYDNAELTKGGNPKRTVWRFSPIEI